MAEYDPAYPGMLNCGYTRFTDVENLSAEQKLFDSYWEELINLYGVGLAWQVHRYDKAVADNLYGEHANQPYADPVKILGLVDLQENAVALSKYGFVTDDTIKLYLHIRTFTETFEPLNIFQDVNQKYIAPKAGDIFTLYEFGKTRPLGLGGKMFEVTDRTDQDVGMNINQLAGHYVWVINAKRYDPSYEPNVEEEKESYQIFDDDYTGRIIDNKEVKELPSEQKAYAYSVEDETNKKVFNYNEYQMSTEMYGGYLKSFNRSNINDMSWYATTNDINEYTLQPTTDLIDGKYYYCVMIPEYNTNGKQGIRIPSLYELTKVEFYNELTNAWSILGGNDKQSLKFFNTTKIPVLYDGEYFDYTQYEYNGPTVGERQMKFYVVPTEIDTEQNVDIMKLNWYATIKGDGTMTAIPVSNAASLGYYEATLAGEKFDTKQAIQVPAQTKISHIELFNTLTQSWEIIGGNAEYSLSLYPATSVILQIDGQHYDYIQYTYNGPTVGSRTTRFYIEAETTTNTRIADTEDVVLPWYATTKSLLTLTKQPADQFINGNYFECEMVAELNNSKHRQTAQIPSKYTIQQIRYFDEQTNQWENIDMSLFDITQVNKTVNNKKYVYNQYTYIGNKADAIILRFYM